jgi:hypothetical protein
MTPHGESGRPGLSPAELLALRDLERRLVEQDPMLDSELRHSCPRASTPTRGRFALLLLSGSLLIGVAAAIVGPGAGLAVALVVLLAAIVVARR